DDDAVAGAVALDERQEGIGGGRLLAIDGDDGVGVAAVDLSLLVGEWSAALLLADNAKCTQTRALGRATRFKRRNLKALLGNGDAIDARIGADDAAFLDELWNHAL